MREHARVRVESVLILSAQGIRRSKSAARGQIKCFQRKGSMLDWV